MSAFPSHCPKCGAKPMCPNDSRPGHYMCDSFVFPNGVLIERLQCVERQRDQAVDALEMLANAACMSEIAFHPAHVEARDVIKKLRGGVL